MPFFSHYHYLLVLSDARDLSPWEKITPEKCLINCREFVTCRKYKMNKIYIIYKIHIKNSGRYRRKQTSRTSYFLVVFLFLLVMTFTITSCLSNSQDPSLSLPWINLDLMHTKFKFYLYIYMQEYLINWTKRHLYNTFIYLIHNLTRRCPPPILMSF